MIAKLVWIEAITQRPAIRCRTSRSARRSDSSSKRSASSSPRPIVFPSRIPRDRERLLHDGWRCRRATPASSSRSAAARCRPGASAARTAGSARTRTARAASSGGACRSIVATTVVTLEAIDVAVFVTTFWTPPMSLLIRDCTSPVRVRVKKASESRCRWRKTAARRSCITRWPTWFESSVWITPRMPATIAITIIAAALIESAARVVRLDRLEDALSRNAGTTPRPAVRTISPSRPESRGQYGLKSAPIAAEVRAPLQGRRAARAPLAAVEEHPHPVSDYAAEASPRRPR